MDEKTYRYCGQLEGEQREETVNRCAWCKKEAPEVFRFVFEDDGEEAFVCGECLDKAEREFYKNENIGEILREDRRG